MRAAGLLIDMGPLAGSEGGEVVFSGKLGTAFRRTPWEDRSLCNTFRTARPLSP